MTDSGLDPELRSRLIETAKDVLWRDCAPAGHVYDESKSVNFVAAAVVDALGIEAVVCGYACDLQDAPIFRIRAAEDPLA